MDECKPLVLGEWTVEAAANASSADSVDGGASNPNPIAASASFSIDRYVLPTFDVTVDRRRLTLSNPI